MENLKKYLTKKIVDYKIEYQSTYKMLCHLIDINEEDYKLGIVQGRYIELGNIIADLEKNLNEIEVK